MGGTTTSADLEPRIREIGGHILDESRRRRRLPWIGAEQSLLARLMADERLRVQVLRFVDVLPALDDDEQLVRHAREYFDPALLAAALPGGAQRFGPLANWGLDHGQGAAAHVIAAAVRAAAQRLARRFIAGDDIDTTLASLRRLRRRGMTFSLDVLGEAAVSEVESHQCQQRYGHLLESLPPHAQRWTENPILDRGSGGRTLPRVNLSVKLSSLYSQINPADFDGSVRAIAGRLRPLMLLARRQQAHITLDMEQFDFKDITLEVFRRTLSEPDLRDWPDVGIALQAYLRSGEEDVASLIDWARRRGTPVRVRLVRGAYWDYETTLAAQHGWPVPVWTEKAETDACYEACIHHLLENSTHVNAAIATHNARSLALAMAKAEALGLTPHDYELQMLYGMADAVKHVLVAMGRRVRVYVPFGDLIPGMAYFVRRLLENTASQSFVRMAMVEDAPPEQLLAPPAVACVISPSGHITPGFTNEPPLRFTDSTQRRHFADAIRQVESQLGRDYPLNIGGKRHETPRRIVSTNPAEPEQVIGYAAAARAEDAARAVEAAERAFPDWRRHSAAQRADLLHAVAELMRLQRSELSAWVLLESGKPWREADAEVVEAIDFLEYYAREALRLDHGVMLDVPGQTNRYVYEPRGPGAVIAPWNFPLAILTGMSAAAIAAGNTVVLKPAPQTPVIAAKMVGLFEQAGMPPGVMNYLPGEDEAGAVLVRDPRIQFIAFTGSMAVGCQILREGSTVAAGQRHIKRVIAEMGGKNAIIIDRSADLDEAIVGVIASAFGYAGQKCSAASRAIVVGDLHDVFLQRLTAAAASIHVGDPRDPGSYMGPVIDKQARQRILAATEQGKSIARLAHLSDVSHLSGGHYLGPTIFTDVPPQSMLGQEEIFGPVLAVIKARDFGEALCIANDVPFGLTGGVYSRTIAHLERARRELEVGNLYLNQKTTGAVVNRQPFGGLKLSGIGSKAGGLDYLQQFMFPRVVTENTFRRGFAPLGAAAPSTQRLPSP